MIYRRMYQKSYKEEPSGYILKCTRYSHVLGGEVCSEFEIYNKVKVEKWELLI